MTPTEEISSPEYEFEPLLILLSRWKLFVVVPILVGSIAIGASFLIKPTFTARASFLPPQQPGGSVGSALSSLGNLAGLAGAGGGTRTPVEQYIALLQSRSLQDRIVDRFELLKLYDEKLRIDALKELSTRLRINLAKREGVISIEVDDHSPQRAADMANAFVEELRKLTSTLAVAEAQQRRLFFDGQLQMARERVAKAQKALQESGFDQSALRAEPRASADAYARLKAEISVIEVRLNSLRSAFSDNAPEVTQQTAALSSMRQMLKRYEGTSTERPADYIERYREFKYQEALFDIYARQFELARADEAKEGGYLQQIDVAQPPERKSKPKRSWIGIGASAVTAAFLIVWVLVGGVLTHYRRDPLRSQQLDRVRQALRGNR